MNVVLKNSQHAVLRFDKGDEIFGGIVGFASEENIHSAHFTGIGTCSEIEIGFYNEFLKEYRKKPFVEGLELISLIGNVAMLEDKPVVHAHGMFGRTDFTTFGGHVFKLIALATCEIHMTIMEEGMTRKNNPDFNLNLLA